MNKPPTQQPSAIQAQAAGYRPQVKTQIEAEATTGYVGVTLDKRQEAGQYRWQVRHQCRSKGYVRFPKLHATEWDAGCVASHLQATCVCQMPLTHVVKQTSRHIDSISLAKDPGLRRIHTTKEARLQPMAEQIERLSEVTSISIKMKACAICAKEKRKCIFIDTTCEYCKTTGRECTPQAKPHKPTTSSSRTRTQDTTPTPQEAPQPAGNSVVVPTTLTHQTAAAGVGKTTTRLKETGRAGRNARKNMGDTRSSSSQAGGTRLRKFPLPTLSPTLQPRRDPPEKALTPPSPPPSQPDTPTSPMTPQEDLTAPSPSETAGEYSNMNDEVHPGRRRTTETRAIGMRQVRPAQHAQPAGPRSDCRPKRSRANQENQATMGSASTPRNQHGSQSQPISTAAITNRATPVRSHVHYIAILCHERNALLMRGFNATLPTISTKETILDAEEFETVLTSLGLFTHSSRTEGPLRKALALPILTKSIGLGAVHVHGIGFQHLLVDKSKDHATKDRRWAPREEFQGPGNSRGRRQQMRLRQEGGRDEDGLDDLMDPYSTIHDWIANSAGWEQIWHATADPPLQPGMGTGYTIQSQDSGETTALTRSDRELHRITGWAELELPAQLLYQTTPRMDNYASILGKLLPTNWTISHQTVNYQESIDHRWPGPQHKSVLRWLSNQGAHDPRFHLDGSCESLSVHMTRTALTLMARRDLHRDADAGTPAHRKFLNGLPKMIHHHSIEEIKGDAEPFALVFEELVTNDFTTGPQMWHNMETALAAKGYTGRGKCVPPTSIRAGLLGTTQFEEHLQRLLHMMGDERRREIATPVYVLMYGTPPSAVQKGHYSLHVLPLILEARTSTAMIFDSNGNSEGTFEFLKLPLRIKLPTSSLDPGDDEDDEDGDNDGDESPSEETGDIPQKGRKRHRSPTRQPAERDGMEWTRVGWIQQQPPGVGPVIFEVNGRTHTGITHEMKEDMSSVEGSRPLLYLTPPWSQTKRRTGEPPNHETVWVSEAAPPSKGDKITIMYGRAALPATIQGEVTPSQINDCHPHSRAPYLATRFHITLDRPNIPQATRGNDASTLRQEKKKRPKQSLQDNSDDAEAAGSETSESDRPLVARFEPGYFAESPWIACLPDGTTLNALLARGQAEIAAPGTIVVINGPLKKSALTGSTAVEESNKELLLKSGESCAGQIINSEGEIIFYWGGSLCSCFSTDKRILNSDIPRKGDYIPVLQTDGSLGHVNCEVVTVDPFITWKGPHPTQMQVISEFDQHSWVTFRPLLNGRSCWSFLRMGPDGRWEADGHLMWPQTGRETTRHNKIYEMLHFELKCGTHQVGRPRQQHQ